jgi:hypothetical protein
VLGDARDKYYNRLRFEVLFCSVLVKGELGDVQVGFHLWRRLGNISDFGVESMSNLYSVDMAGEKLSL